MAESDIPGSAMPLAELALPGGPRLTAPSLPQLKLNPLADLQVVPGDVAHRQFQHVL